MPIPGHPESLETGSQAYFLPGTFMSINSFGLQNNPISTVILGDRCYCHLHFYMETEAYRGWVTCPSSQSQEMPEVGFKPKSQDPCSFSSTHFPSPFHVRDFLGTCGPPSHCLPTPGGRSGHSSLPAHCTLPSVESWRWVFYSLTKMLSVGCPQIYPPWAN